MKPINDPRVDYRTADDASIYFTSIYMYIANVSWWVPFNLGNKIATRENTSYIYCTSYIHVGLQKWHMFM